MNVDKAKKRIAKLVKRGFHGYPLVSLEYFGKEPFGKTPTLETIQSALVKIIERADAKTVTEIDGTSALE